MAAFFIVIYRQKESNTQFLPSHHELLVAAKSAFYTG